MHDRLVSRRIDALHQCFLVTTWARALNLMSLLLSGLRSGPSDKILKEKWINFMRVMPLFSLLYCMYRHTVGAYIYDVLQTHFLLYCLNPLVCWTVCSELLKEALNSVLGYILNKSFSEMDR